MISALLLALQPAPTAAQQARARVVDQGQRSPIEGAEALLLGSDSSQIARAVSGPNGFFTLTAPGPGEYLLRVEGPGYEAVWRAVVIGPGTTTVPAFVLPMAVIPVEGMTVEVDRREIEQRPAIDRRTGRSSHVLMGERLASLEESGVSLAGVVRELGPGIRVRSVGPYTCIESGRGGGGGGGCSGMVAIVMDGMDLGLDPEDAMRYLRSFDVAQFESIELLTPAEAGFRYGLNAARNGALVLWTRGFGPHRSQARDGG